MGGVEVEPAEVELAELQDIAGDVGEDVVAFLEEGVQATGEAVVVELFGRNVAQVLDAVLLGPLGDVDQGGGTVQAGGQKHGEDGAVRDLRVAGQMPIDDGGDVEFVDQGLEQSEGAEVDDAGFRDGIGWGNKRHGAPP